MDNRSLLVNQQILASIVDGFLRDNNFSQTRNIFRNEASFIFNSTVFNQLSMNVLSIVEILDKLQWLDQERDRTQKLLQSMESVMHSYFSNVCETNVSLPPLPSTANSAVAPTVPLSINTNARIGNFSTPVMVDQERVRMERERYQTRLLMFSMQDLINNYKLCGSFPETNILRENDIGTFPKTNILMPPPQPNANSVTVSQPKLGSRFPTGVTTIATPPSGFLVHQSIKTNATTENVSKLVMSDSNKKRKDTEAMDAPPIAKKSRGRPRSKKFPLQGQNTLPQSNNVVNKQIVSQPSSTTQLAGNFVPSGSEVQNSSVAKCFFNLPPVSIPINSPVPKTPTRTTSCQSDADISVIVNPPEHVDYIKSSYRISPVETDSNKESKSDHVRSRLGFAASDMLENLDKPLPNEISTCETNKENELPELANLTFDGNNDVLGENISFTGNDLWTNISSTGDDLGTKFPLSDNNGLQADFPFIDDDLETFADLLNDPDLPWVGVDFSDSYCPVFP